MTHLHDSLSPLPIELVSSLPVNAPLFFFFFFHIFSSLLSPPYLLLSVLPIWASQGELRVREIESENERERVMLRERESEIKRETKRWDREIGREGETEIEREIGGRSSMDRRRRREFRPILPVGWRSVKPVTCNPPDLRERTRAVRELVRTRSSINKLRQTRVEIWQSQ
jgi:hypothetical protein